MWRSCLAGLLCLGVFACETAPVAVEMTPAAFDEALTDAAAEPHPWLTIAALTDTYETQTLSADQKARLLFERGSVRREAGINLPGAVSDFKDALAAAPESSVAENAGIEMGYAESSWGAAAGRLKGMQTLPKWFDDMVATGELPAAAERYRESGLAPTSEQARLLEAAGYLCARAGTDEAVWEYGEETGHLDALKWCESPAVS